tara:strand:- start:2448 stop:4814 length:2367 start_codon:yes stop_codon:yes gene_type:complete
LTSHHYSDFERSPVVDQRFGAPDFDAWRLFDQSGLKKKDAVKVLHLLFRSIGGSIEQTRTSINTYTTVAYKLADRNLTSDAVNNKNYYSEDKHFGFLYAHPIQLPDTERLGIKQALNSEWAMYVAKNIGADIQQVLNILDDQNDVLRITLSAGAISNGYIPIPSDQSLFDSRYLGGSSESEVADVFSLQLPNGETIETDIRSPSGRGGRIRARFYQLFKDYALAAGAMATIKALANADVFELTFESETALETFITPGRKAMSTVSLNQILYGPPGTGKTWSTTEYAVRLADPAFFDNLGTSGSESADLREKLQQRYQELVDAGRIVFTTFHQSFSYEDFVEGIRAETKDESLSYDVQDGIFKSLALLADASSAPEGGLEEGIDLVGRRVWKMSLGNTLKGEDEAYEDCIEKAYIGLGWGEDIDFTGCDSRESVSARYSEKTGEQYNGMAYNITAVNTFKNTISNGDIVIVSDGNHKFRAIGEVIGEYHYSSDPEIDYFHQQRPVRWLRVFDTSVPKEALFHKSLSQMTLYELKSKTVKLDQLRTFLSTKTTEYSAPENYVLIIDEINRGNISRIFGELITLLEPDKRKGGADERKIVLPYSKLPFTVPANLHVLGTMNTADKSLAQIDLALRRRFEFVELLPDPQKLSGVFVHGVAMSEILAVINQRIEVLLDRDHTIGHAYFWPIRAAATEEERQWHLAQIFEKRVIPLLREYFFADWERIGWVLNDPAKPYDVRFIQQGKVGRPVQDLFSAEVAGQLNDRRYAINQAAFSNPAAYSGILSTAFAET